MPYATTLTQGDLEFGKNVTEQLSSKGYPFEGAFWLYDETSEDWRLVIATNLVDQEGRQQAYFRLAQAVPFKDRSYFRSANITVMSPQDSVFLALKKTFAARKSVEGERLQAEVVNGVLIPDTYLYEIR